MSSEMRLFTAVRGTVQRSDNFYPVDLSKGDFQIPLTGFCHLAHKDKIWPRKVKE